jgi:hypothetical protein
MPYVITAGPLSSTEPSVRHSEGMGLSTGAKIIADFMIIQCNKSEIQDARLSQQYLPGCNPNPPKMLHHTVCVGIIKNDDTPRIDRWNSQTKYDIDCACSDPAHPATIVRDANVVPVLTTETTSFASEIAITVKKDGC